MGFISFCVNGVLFTTRRNLQVREILLMACGKSAISTNKINEYQLVRAENNERWENQDDWVSITDGNSFIAVHQGVEESDQVYGS